MSTALAIILVVLGLACVLIAVAAQVTWKKEHKWLEEQGGFWTLVRERQRRMRENRE